MARIFKRRRKRPLPATATVRTVRGRRTAEWTDRKGRTWRAPVEGDKVVMESRRWYFTYRLASGEERTLVGASDRAVTEAMARKLESEQREYALGTRDDRAERTAQQERSPIVVAASSTGRSPILKGGHLFDYISEIESRNRTDKHVTETMGYIRRSCEQCGFQCPRDITASQLLDEVSRLRRAGKSQSNLNHRIRAMKSFTKWLHASGRLRVDPLTAVRTGNTNADRRHVRRALTDDEAMRLIAAAERGPDIAWRTGGVEQCITGPDRAMLYRTALVTGFRVSELRSLEVSSFHLEGDEPTITVEAAHSKHRREDVQPIRESLARRLRVWLAQRPADGRVFEIPHDTARMIRGDLEAAGVAQVDDSGRVVDFHALRHTFITRLTRSGVAPAVAKELARHSTITLTMDHYTHVLVSDRREALGMGRDFDCDDTSHDQRARPTGTDSRPEHM